MIEKSDGTMLTLFSHKMTSHFLHRIHIICRIHSIFLIRFFSLFSPIKSFSVKLFEICFNQNNHSILFGRYDVGQDGFLDLSELKFMMEKLQAPQTHLGLKAMIAEVDEDQDGKISFREFLLIYR